MVLFRSWFFMDKCQGSYLNRSVLSLPCLLIAFIGLLVWIRLCTKVACSQTGSSEVQVEIAMETDELMVKPGMGQFDPILHKLIRQGHIIQPIPRNVPYFLPKPWKDPSMGQGQVIRKLFQNKKHGFFIECGALDGKTRSNTLGLELDLQWTGILIEGDPNSISKLLSKGRKSFVVPNCLATKNITMKVSYGSFFNLGRIVDENGGAQGSKIIEVMCLPLYAILKALQVTQVDYFSLDVEGNELQVLRTIPWESVNILALSVEFTHIGKAHTVGSKSDLETFMKSKGYQKVAKVTNRKSLANDFIFAKNGVFNDISLDDVIS